ncbi:MAG: polymerase, sigma-24 subunit, subfamily [Pedosphaera sp.]|nr:polymerase, sigma-24 subunit, subfamily [Pedosphaera sp.]
MPAKSDAELLREYARGGSQAAFGEIVARYTDLVCSAALRQMGSPDLARDVGQNVFTDLARKASSVARKLNEEGTLVGWLYRSTRYEALTFLREERRRQARERQVMQDFDSAPETVPDWDRIRPLLDEAMAGLSEPDRQALLLRFFQRQDFQAVGVALGVSDDAAQKRVARALDKLRAHLNRRGGTTTMATLAAALSANAVQTAPAGLAAAFTSASLASAAGAGITITVLKLMTMTKLKAALLLAATTAGIATSIVQHQSNQKLQKENRALLEQTQLFAQLQQENDRLSNLVAHAGQSLLSQDQMADLLRLRGEVGRLRSEQQRMAAIGQTKTTNQAPAATKAEEPDAQKPFTADLTARVGNGETLVAGWPTAPGKRTLVLITPGTNSWDIDAGNVDIRSVVIEASEEALARTGLDRFRSDGSVTSLKGVLTGAELEAFKALMAGDGATVLSAPEIVTADGRQAQVSIAEGTHAVDENHLPSHLIDFVPHFTADRNAVDLSIQVSIQPAGPPVADNK